jgi:hypothetical protein
MAEHDGPRTFSVSFRLQRTTVEETFVSVQVTDELTIRQPDGTGRLNVPKMVERAIEMGQELGVVWQPESQEVHPHPIQKPPPGAASTVN